MRMNQEYLIINNPADTGFTLVELLVALAIFSLVVASIYSSFGSQNKIYHAQEKVATIQQNIRAAMYIMERDIRMAGYNPDQRTVTPPFGITACGPTNITFTQDDDSGGIATTTFTLSGTTLQRNGATLAQNIEAFGLAYAYDANGDGNLDTVGGNVIWAIDTGNDNQLDLNLDTDANGIINQADDTNANNVIEGVALSSAIPAASIRAVRIWILGRSDSTRPDIGYSDSNTYVVGRSIIHSPNDGLHRRMLTSIVKCRNMGVQ
jgi:type IV pilus assembly protein PilW